MVFVSSIGGFGSLKLYEKNYMWYLALPILCFIAMSYLVFVSPGIVPGVDLTGGTLITIRSPQAIDQTQLTDFLENNFQLADLQVNTVSSPLGYGANIQFAENVTIAGARTHIETARSMLSTNPTQAESEARQGIEIASAFAVPAGLGDAKTPEEVVAFSEQFLNDAKDSFNQQIQERVAQEFNLGSDAQFSRKDIAPVLGKVFFESAVTVALASVIFMIIVIFYLFRELVPSATIIAAAVLDVLFSAAAMAWFKVPLSLASIPTLLLLVGYSIDTDILLTTRMLKRTEGTEAERAQGSLATGLTMTLTTMAAVTAMMVLSYFTQLQVMFEIAFLLFFGLIGDIVGTWLMSAPVLLLYVEWKKKRKTA